MPVRPMRRLLERLVPNERNRAHIERLFRESFRDQRRRYAIAIAAMVVVAATSAAIAFLMEAIVDAMTQYESRTLVFLVAAGVAATFMLKGIATYVQLVSLSRAGNRIVANQQERLYEKLLRHDVSFFSLRNSSEILTRMTTGAESARRVIELIVTSAARDMVMLAGLVAVMFYQQPALSLVSVIVGPLAIYALRRLVARVRGIMESQIRSSAEIVGVIQETAKGIQVIKIFSLEDRMNARMGRAVRQVEGRANKMARLSAATSPLMDTLSGLAIAGVVALSALDLFGPSETSAGELMSFITALLMAYEPAKRLSKVRVGLEANLVGVDMMYGLLDYSEKLSERPGAAALARGPGRVELRGVGFAYREGAPLFEGLDLAFEAGLTSALVGPSGGGKSTILNLVMRLYDPAEGSVLIDGQDIRDVTFASLRDRISFVGQDTFLFANTVMENIRCSRPEATDIEVYEAARAANAHDFIRALPEGYDTQVGENGVFLSGGQRQRLAIARAVLRRSEILLLDEATSALDASSEALIREALERLTRGKTTIVIAHRLSTVLGADRIFVLADGKVEESGTADELLAREGRFKTLFDQQFGGYREALGQ